MIRYLPISGSEVPIRKTYTLEGIDYEFLFLYNEVGDFVTATISIDGTIVHATKLVYGIDIFKLSASRPKFAVVPMSMQDISKAGYSNILVNKSTLGSDVYLLYNDGVEE